MLKNSSLHRLWIYIAVAVFWTVAAVADTKISDLPLGSAASSGANDPFPYVELSSNTTKKMRLSDLVNLPVFSSTYSAPFANRFLNAPSGCPAGEFASDIDVFGNLTCAVPGPPGTGDVVGPASSTDNAVTRFDGITGKLIQNSLCTIDDLGNETCTSFIGSLTGNASTATALASNPTDCGVGEFANAIDSQGNLTCATPAGSGDVSGPGSSTDNAVVRWDGITGTLVQDSGCSIDDLGNITCNSFIGNASTATALASNPTDCGAGEFANAIDAQGNLTCATPAGTGDVVGPSSATDNALARFDGTTGKLIQDSGCTLDDLGNLTCTSFFGNASTATALAANPVDCSAGQYANTIAANGDLTCSQVDYSQLAGIPSIYYQIVQSNGVSETQRTKLNLSTDFDLTDDPVNNATNVFLKSSIGVNSASSTMLASDPTDCGVGEFANAIDAFGNLTCATPSTGGSGDATITSVNQTAHGFVIGDVVRFNGTSYVKSQADIDANSEVYGVVSTVVDADNFKITTEGHITGLSGLTSGATYFLSTVTPGALSSTSPTSVGQVNRPVLLADSTTSGFVIQARGYVITQSVPLLTTKGDLITFDGSQGVRLGVGSNGTVMTADSTTTEGIAWKTIPDGTSVSKSFTQTAHGFAVGDVIYNNAGTWAKAKADADATSETIGMVSAVADADNFTLTTGGYISGLSGFTAGSTYYLSDATAGALTSTEPTTASHYSCPLFVADSTTSGYFFKMRCAEIQSQSSQSVPKFAIANISNTGSCAISSQIGDGVDSVSDAGVGLCAVTFKTGKFASAPICTMGINVSGGYQVTISVAATTSGVTFRTIDTSAQSVVDKGFNFACWGN